MHKKTTRTFLKTAIVLTLHCLFLLIFTSNALAAIPTVTKSKCESAKGEVFENIGCGTKCDGADMALVATCTGASNPAATKCCVFPLTDKNSKPITQAEAIQKFADFVGTTGTDDLTDEQCKTQGGGSGTCVKTVLTTDSSLCPQKIGTCTKTTAEGSRTCCKPKDPGTQTQTTGGGSFTPLERIPFLDEDNPDFPTYVKAIYNFAIWSVAIAALLMIVIGGFFYLTAAGNTSQLGTAKTIIWDALIGLFVAFFAWLVLYEINPDLVTIDLSSLSSLYSEGTGGSATQFGASGTSSPSAQQGPTPAGSSDNSACKKYSSNNAGCGLASSTLNGFISCMGGKISSGCQSQFRITSVTSNSVGSDLAASQYCCTHGKSGKCPHTSGSCHHGCKTSQKGYSFAIDVGMRAGNSCYCDIANAAVSCGAVEKGGPTSKCGISAWPGHADHFHFSVGCD